MTEVPRGVYEVTCRSCGVRGSIQVKSQRKGQVKIEDRIPHADTCPQKKPEQALHFIRKAWRKQERQGNELVGARATIASGAVGADGDGRTMHGWRVESKGTAKDVYVLKRDIWDKLVSGALEAGEEPLLYIHLSQKVRAVRLVIIRRDFYKALSPEMLTLWSLRHEPTPDAASVRICPEDLTQPRLVPFGPHLGVVLAEQEFTRKLEAWRASHGDSKPDL